MRKFYIIIFLFTFCYLLTSCKSIDRNPLSVRVSIKFDEEPLPEALGIKAINGEINFSKKCLGGEYFLLFTIFKNGKIASFDNELLVMHFPIGGSPGHKKINGKLILRTIDELSWSKVYFKMYVIDLKKIELKLNDDSGKKFKNNGYRIYLYEKCIMRNISPFTMSSSIFMPKSIIDMGKKSFQYGIFSQEKRSMPKSGILPIFFIKEGLGSGEFEVQYNGDFQTLIKQSKSIMVMFLVKINSNLDDVFYSQQ